MGLQKAGGTMTDQEEQSIKEVRRREKLIKEEAERLARERERKKAYLAREQVIEKASEAKEAERSQKRAVEESEQANREKARKDAFLAREKMLAEAAEAKKLREKKQQPE
jgi:hypothetical protein